MKESIRDDVPLFWRPDATEDWLKVMGENYGLDRYIRKGNQV